MYPQSITDSSFQQAFFAKLLRVPSGCLEWQGTKSNGYGKIRCAGKAYLSHRVAWIIAHGQIPESMFVLHHCDNPACCDAVSEGHLFLGTHLDNMHDCKVKGRRPVFRGEQNGFAKLTEADVLDIRRTYVRGSHEFGQYALARRFNVDQTLIGLVVRRKAWRHI